MRDRPFSAFSNMIWWSVALAASWIGTLTFADAEAATQSEEPMAPLLGEYGFLTEFSGLSEQDARNRVRYMHDEFGILEFQFYDAMQGYSRPPAPQLDVWENRLSRKSISRNILQAFVDEIAKLGGRSWLYVQAMATDPGDRQMQFNGFNAVSHHIAGSKVLLDVVAINATWAERVVPQWSFFASSLGFSGIHWDTLAEADALQRSDIPGFLRAALPLVRAQGLEQTCNFIDGHGWDSSLAAGSRVGATAWTFTIRTSRHPIAGSQEGVTFSFLVNGTWTEKQATGGVQAGEEVSVAVALSSLPSEVKIWASGDSIGFESIVLSSGADSFVILATTSFQGPEPGENAHWLSIATEEYSFNDLFSYIVPGERDSARPIRLSGQEEMCITIADDSTVGLSECSSRLLRPASLFFSHEVGGAIRWAADPTQCLKAKQREVATKASRIELGPCDHGALLLSSRDGSGAPGPVLCKFTPNACLGALESAQLTRDQAPSGGLKLMLSYCLGGIPRMMFAAQSQPRVVAFPYWEIWHPAKTLQRFFSEMKLTAGGGVMAWYPGRDANHYGEDQNKASPGVPPLTLVTERWLQAREHGSAYLVMGDGNRQLQTEYFPEAKPLSEDDVRDIQGKVFGVPEPGSVVNSGDVVYLLLKDAKKHLSLDDGDRLTLRAGHGVREAFIIEMQTGSGPLRHGSEIYLRAHSGKLLEASSAVRLQVASARRNVSSRFVLQMASSMDQDVHAEQDIYVQAAGGSLLQWDGALAAVVTRPQRDANQRPPEALFTLQKAGPLHGTPFDCWQEGPAVAGLKANAPTLMVGSSASDWLNQTAGWSRRKKAWCCHKGLSWEHCQVAPAQLATKVDNPHSVPTAAEDCSTGQDSWSAKWSDSRMWSCCRSQQRGCPPEASTAKIDVEQKAEKIFQVFGSQCLDAGGGNLHVWECSDSSGQDWVSIPHSGHLVNKQHNLCLDAYTDKTDRLLLDVPKNAASQVLKPVLNPCQWTSPTQTWDFVEVTVEQHVLKHRESGLCLNIEDMVKTSLRRCDNNAAPTMRWRLPAALRATKTPSEDIVAWKALGLTPAYECTEGASLWKGNWSDEQKRWCCYWTRYDRENWPAKQQAFCSNLSYFRQS